MSDPLLSPVMRSEHLLDLAAVATPGGGASLVTIERQGDAAAGPEGPVQPTRWRFWRPGDAGAFAAERTLAIELPASQRVALAAQGPRVAALVPTNRQGAAAWALGSDDLQAPQGLPLRAPLRLRPQERASVQIAPRDEWSTAGLGMSDWLFHPSASSLGPDAGFALAANTADGRAVAWRWSGHGAPEPLGQLAEAALEPVLLRVAGQDQLWFRAKPATWPMYYRDARYSGQFGPTPLPLTLWAEGRRQDLSAALGVEGVLAFSAAAAPQGGVVLALVSGPPKAPVLGLHVQRGASWVRLWQATLRGMPYRLALAVGGETALLGVAYRERADYAVEGLKLPLR